MKKRITTSSLRAIALLGCALVALAFVLPINAARAQNNETATSSPPFLVLSGHKLKVHYAILPPPIPLPKRQVAKVCTQRVGLEVREQGQGVRLAVKEEVVNGPGEDLDLVSDEVPADTSVIVKVTRRQSPLPRFDWLVAIARGILGLCSGEGSVRVVDDAGNEVLFDYDSIRVPVVTLKWSRANYWMAKGASR